LAKKAAPGLDAIIRVIRESDNIPDVRAAIMDLGYEKNPEAYPILIEQLNDPNSAIQHAAIISLGRFGRPEAIEEICKPKIFKSPEGNIRWAAVAAIGKLGDYRVIDCLLKGVEDPEWIVRTQALTELKSKVQDIIAHKNVRLARILVHMFTLDNEEIINLAIDGFQGLGVESLRLLHDALNNSSVNIRANAARTLGKLRCPQSTPYLMELLKDEDGRVRASAAEALGLIQDKASIEALVLMIQDNVEKVQEQAVAAIARFGRQATIPLLNALSREKDKFSQRALLRCLGLISDPKSTPAIISCLRNSYFVVRQAAVVALVRFGPPVTKLLVPTLSYNLADIEKLKKDALDKERPELQMRAIKALGGLEDHRAVRLLKQLVAESLPDVQEAAASALSLIGCASWGRCYALKVLAEIGDASLVPQIAPSLGDDSDNVRFEAVRTIAKVGGCGTTRHLIQIAKKDKADFIRAEAIRMLRTVGIGRPGVLDAALRALKDEARIVRRQAARLLGNFQDPKSILPLLRAMADPHWSIRESAEVALTNFGRDAVLPLIGALESKSWTTRFRAARLLGEIGDPRAVPSLRNVIGRRRERKGVREIAETSLRKIEAKIQS